MILFVLGISLFIFLGLNKRKTLPLSRIRQISIGFALILINVTSAMAQPVWAPHKSGGEANLKIPDLTQVNFLGGTNGHSLLLIGFLVSFLGVVFGFVIYKQLKKLSVHRAMSEISELIYETCKTYLITQGKFLLLLELFIAVIIMLYFGLLLKFEAVRVAIILLFSLVGIA